MLSNIHEMNVWQKILLTIFCVGAIPFALVVIVPIGLLVGLAFLIVECCRLLDNVFFTELEASPMPPEVRPAPGPSPAPKTCGCSAKDAVKRNAC